MTVSLLDINVLIALAWPSHVHHRHAHSWFNENASDGWATCPFTECGFVRISSNPKIIPEAASPKEALSVLRRICELDYHAFWADDIDFCTSEYNPTQLLVGHRQVTDAYLLGLAISKGGRLATLDKSVSALLPTSSPHADSVCVVPVD